MNEEPSTRSDSDPESGSTISRPRLSLRKLRSRPPMPTSAPEAPEETGAALEVRPRPAPGTAPEPDPPARPTLSTEEPRNGAEGTDEISARPRLRLRRGADSSATQDEGTPPASDSPSSVEANAAASPPPPPPAREEPPALAPAPPPGPPAAKRTPPGKEPPALSDDPEAAAASASGPSVSLPAAPRPSLNLDPMVEEPPTEEENAAGARPAPAGPPKRKIHLPDPAVPEPAPSPLVEAEESPPSAPSPAPPRQDGSDASRPPPSPPPRQRQTGKPPPPPPSWRRPGGATTLPGRQDLVISTLPRSTSPAGGDRSPPPPPVSIDSMRPSPSLKPPPPSGAPVHEPPPRKRRGLHPLVITAIVFGLWGAGIAYPIFVVWTGHGPTIGPITHEGLFAPAESEIAGTAPGSPSAEPPAPPAVEAAIVAETASQANEASPAAPVERAPEPLPAVRRLVEGFTINMVRNRGAQSMVVLDSVVYPLDAVIDPSSGLRFAGFSDSGDSLVFEDARGARYLRAF